MTFAFSELIMIVLLLAILFYWSSSQRIREIALWATKIHCQKMNIQLLDDYVALNALWLKRDRFGKLRLWRSFLFEFTATGEDRYNGKIIMLGDLIESINLEPHRIP